MKHFEAFLWDIAVFIISLLLFLFFLPPTVDFPKFENLMTALLSISTTAAGFTLTIVTVLAGFSKGAMFKKIEKHKHLATLRLIYIKSLVWDFIIILASVLVIIFAKEDVLSKFTFILSMENIILFFVNLFVSTAYLVRALIGSVSDDEKSIDRIDKV